MKQKYLFCIAYISIFKTISLVGNHEAPQRGLSFRHQSSIALTGRDLDGREDYNPTEVAIARRLSAENSVVRVDETLSGYQNALAGLMDHMNGVTAIRANHKPADQEVYPQVSCRDFFSKGKGYFIPAGDVAHCFQGEASLSRGVAAANSLLSKVESVAIVVAGRRWCLERTSSNGSLPMIKMSLAN